MTEREFELSVEKIRAGNKDGLQEIYMAYAKFIYAVVYDILKSKENTEDVVSEFFIKMWRVLDDYRAGSGHKGYLATIARNMAIDLLRKNKHEVPMSSEGYEDEDGNRESGIYDEKAVEEADIKGTPESQVLGQMSVEETLSVLKDNERQIVTMKVLSDMTFKEISEVLGMPMGTVTWSYQNAIKKIRRCGYE